jgi:hypothetical protein
MQYKNHWAILVLVIIGLWLTACVRNPDTPEKVEPAKVEPLEGGISRVVLTEKAAERLDIQTAPVREELVVRKRTVGGEVMAVPDADMNNPGEVMVRVQLNESDMKKVDLDEPALVLPMTGTEEAAGLPAHPVEGSAVGNPDETVGALYYMVDSEEHDLVPGQIVLIELQLTSSGEKRKVIPYGAVLYDLHGETWVYTNPETLIFVRHSIVVDYIEGGMAVLIDGPPAGTAVATVGVAELFGTEFGVGK